MGKNWHVDQERKQARSSQDGERVAQVTNEVIYDRIRQWRGALLMDNQFAIGNRVQFTKTSVRANSKRSSISMRTVHGTILEISDKGVARIKINRSKNCCTCHVSNLRLEGQRSALTEAFVNQGNAAREFNQAMVNMTRELNQIAAECDKESDQ
jgi:hypothetical protein